VCIVFGCQYIVCIFLSGRDFFSRGSKLYGRFPKGKMGGILRTRKRILEGHTNGFFRENMRFAKREKRGQPVFKKVAKGSRRPQKMGSFIRDLMKKPQ